MKCPCGHPIYANTEDWVIPLCYACYVDKKAKEYSAKLPENERKAINSFWKWLKRQ